MKKFLVGSAVLMISLGVSLSPGVYADKGGHPRNESRDHSDRAGGVSHPPGFRMDRRYDHNRYYPPRDYRVKALPDRYHVVHHHHRDYFYLGGVWYLSSGAGFVVVRPPLGIIVPILPPFYTTLWVGGIPYYYANDSYYTWRADRNGYEVTAPPVGESEPALPYVADELYVYPKEGQSEQRQADDRYACHRWGVEQTGYDPTQPPADLSVAELNRERADYNRAMKACLEGRGYSVR